MRELAKLQKKLFKSAYQALKPDGEMVYSTCTLNKEENEDILLWAIQELGIKLLPIKINIKNAETGNLQHLDMDSSEKIGATSVVEEVKKAIRILPSKETEGFFVAKIKKD